MKQYRVQYTNETHPTQVHTFTRPQSFSQSVALAQSLLRKRGERSVERVTISRYRKPSPTPIP